MTIDAAATAIAQSAARKTADRVAREVAAPLVEAARAEARQASTDEARSVAATVAAETARSVASATASTDLPGLMDAFMEANPVPVIPGVSGVDGAKGDKGDKGDPGLNWRGAWRPNTTYRPTDAVEYDGSSYVATGTTMARPPKLPWDLLAKKGAPGLPGRDARSGGGGGGFGGGGMGGATPNLAAVLAVGADAGAHAITGLTDPTNAQDAATKAYVDANAGGGGGSVRWLDLGIVTAVDLLAGAQTLYTTAAGEFVSAIRYGDAVVAVDGNFLIGFDIADWRGAGGGTRYGEIRGPVTADVADAAGTGIHTSAGFNAGVDSLVFTSPPLLAGSLVAALAINYGGIAPTVGTTPGWQANQLYPFSVAIIEAGHFWENSGPQTSGNVKPDFAGNLGGSVADGALTWYDDGTVTTGSAHVYIEVVTPEAP